MPPPTGSCCRASAGHRSQLGADRYNAATSSAARPTSTSHPATGTTPSWWRTRRPRHQPDPPADGRPMWVAEATLTHARLSWLARAGVLRNPPGPDHRPMFAAIAAGHPGRPDPCRYCGRAASSRTRTISASTGRSSVRSWRRTTSCARVVFKRSSIAGAMTETLRTRGPEEPAAGLAAELGVRAYYVGCGRWIDAEGTRSFSELGREALDEARAADRTLA